MQKEFDVVYVLGNGSSNDNEELRYSLRSVEKYMTGVRNVFVVGANPGFLSDKVIYIPTKDLFPHDHLNKDRNHWHNIETACKDPRLSEDFLFAADDNIILKESRWEDFIPRHTGEVTKEYLNTINDPNINDWRRQRIRTLLRFNGKKTYLWHPHMFTQLNKTKFLQCCKDCDYINRGDVVIFSYYFNHDPMPVPLQDFDTEEYHSARKITFNARHISHWDEAFSYPPFKEQLKSIFPKKSKYEKNEINDKSKYDATVIIPCYNSEKYLDDCLKSIHSAKYSIQVICINDGSTDSTLEKMQSSSIVTNIFSWQENKGLSYARNYALEHSKGKYIILLDSDDKLEIGAIDFIIDQMKTKSLDIFYINAKAFFDSKNDNEKYKRYEKYYKRPQMLNIMSGKQALLYFFSCNNNDHAACTYAFRREFLIDIGAKYRNGILFEDAPFNIYASLCAKRTFNSSLPLYLRRVHSSSIVSSIKTFKHLRSYILDCKDLTAYICKKCNIDTEQRLINYLLHYQLECHFQNACKIPKDNCIDLYQYNDAKDILVYKTMLEKVKYRSIENYKKIFGV